MNAPAHSPDLTSPQTRPGLLRRLWLTLMTLLSTPQRGRNDWEP